MPRPTIFTGQWADLPLEKMAAIASEIGYDGLELALGRSLEVDKALADDDYCQSRIDLLNSHGLNCWAISNHLVGQAVCDRIDHRHHHILPDRIWGHGDAEGVKERAIEEMKDTARAAARLGVPVVNGFTGSSIWPDLYFFPPTPPDHVKRGYDDFANRWGPVLTSSRTSASSSPSKSIQAKSPMTSTPPRPRRCSRHHEAFGFNFDPSHLVCRGSIRRVS